MNLPPLASRLCIFCIAVLFTFGCSDDTGGSKTNTDTAEDTSVPDAQDVAPIDVTCDATGTTCVDILTCDPADGTPTSCAGCADGSWGTACERTCDASGTSCVTVDACDQSTGEPTACTDCDPGAWGPDCANTCPDNSDCDRVGTCDQSNGATTRCNGCSDGAWGDICENACSNTDTQCDAVLACAQSDGAPTLCEGCAFGFFGANCESGCDPEGTTCSTITVCAEDGTPTTCSACNDGQWGVVCENACSTTNSNCDDVVACAPEDGRPLICAACNDGFYGDDCTTACEPPTSCTGTTACDQETGDATTCETCAPGYYGVVCEFNYPSCKAIKSATDTTTDGLYTIDPDEDGPIAPFDAWCDMNTDGGGWTLVMRAIGNNFAYNDPAWTTAALTNPAVFDFTAAGLSKYEAFNTVPFDIIRTSDTTDFATNLQHTLDTPQESALALFTGPGFSLGTTLVAYLNDRATPGARQSGCTTYINYGFNQQDNLGTEFLPGGSFCDWNGGARWGQRVNADHNATGNHAGQGWGAYSTISVPPHTDLTGGLALNQLLWVR